MFPHCKYPISIHIIPFLFPCSFFYSSLIIYTPCAFINTLDIYLHYARSYARSFSTGPRYFPKRGRAPGPLVCISIILISFSAQKLAHVSCTPWRCMIRISIAFYPPVLYILGHAHLFVLARS
ncbi:hypothetical protein BCR43DRAFT_24221 [Syncephalastrum racemosum]|uniref:Uncharacterized protein n=1 Tax=Syncephalastrum racemosum TaxID=13706 RepID=A0A1X2HUM9_SYNRA|nr:hypothetical protein BCR43DRAFT_24221 [Syncephalastrum racemosum]